MTTDTDTILVLGATGKVGRRLVPALRASGRQVKAASRTGAVRFDWHEQDTWAGALEAVDAGVRRFTAPSGRGMDRVPVGVFAGMAAGEKAVQGSGVEWTALRPNNFQQNFDEDAWQAPLRAGRLALPAGDVPEPFVDVRDIAEVAAVLLTSEGFQGEVYEISGARALTFAEIASAAQRPLTYEELTPEEYRADLLELGYRKEAVHDLDPLFAMMRTGHSATPTWN
ncbi:SDR family oxidoreductase [Streptomyces sp. S6]